MNADEKIWRYLKSAGLNDFGVAGLMGNLFAESGLNPKNLQNTYEKKLGMTDSGAEGRGKIIIRGGFSYDRARDRTVN